MRRFLIVLLSLLVSCSATGSGNQLNLVKLHQHVDAAEQTLGAFVVANSATDPAFAKSLADLQNAVHVLDERIQSAAASGTGSVDLLGGVDLALSAADALVGIVITDPLRQSRVRTVGALVQGVLLQIRIELAPDQPVPAPKPTTPP